MQAAVHILYRHQCVKREMTTISRGFCSLKIGYERERIRDSRTRSNAYNTNLIIYFYEILIFMTIGINYIIVNHLSSYNFWVISFFSPSRCCHTSFLWIQNTRNVSGFLRMGHKTRVMNLISLKPI